MHSVIKHYRNLPAAHRQPNHEGHCRLIHGHNWGFDIEFVARRLDACGFVVDVGQLQLVKQFLDDTFDHTLLLNYDDPLVAHPAQMGGISALAKVILVPNCGMEGLAEYVWIEVQRRIDSGYVVEGGADRGLSVLHVTCWEDEKNCATYTPTRFVACAEDELRRIA